MCIRGFISGQGIEEVGKHTESFLTTFWTLKRTTKLSGEEHFLMKCMCKDIFCWLTGRIGREDELTIPNVKGLPSEESKAETLYQLAKLSISLLQEEVDSGATY
jgi:hypothetical protein